MLSGGIWTYVPEVVSTFFISSCICFHVICLSNILRNMKTGKLSVIIAEGIKFKDYTSCNNYADFINLTPSK